MKLHDGLTDLLIQIMSDVGFKIEKKTLEWTMTKTKAEAVEYIRNRSVSSWENLTDEELEEGVREVLGKPGDIIEINTEKEIIIACKESK